MRGSEGAVRKVPTEATRWRPTLLLVRFGKGFIETYSLRGEQGAMSLLHPALRSALRSGSPRVVVIASGMTGDQDEWGVQSLKLSFPIRAGLNGATLASLDVRPPLPHVRSVQMRPSSRGGDIPSVRLVGPSAGLPSYWPQPGGACRSAPSTVLSAGPSHSRVWRSRSACRQK
jgi:hypothetical protein